MISITTYKTVNSRFGIITVTNTEGVQYKITVNQHGFSKNPNQHEHLSGKYQLVFAITDSADYVLVSVWVCSTCGWINSDTANVWTMPN